MSVLLRGICCSLLLVTLVYSVAHGADLTGRVNYADVYRFDTGVDGVVEAITVQEGERVLQGTLLLKLEDTALQSSLAAANATLHYAEALFGEATRAFERDEVLYDEGSLSAVELDLRRIDMLNKKAAVAQAQAAVAEHQSRLSRSKIFAPVAGVLLKRHVNEGENINLVARTEPMLVFAANDKMVEVIVNSEATTVPKLLANVGLRFGENSEQGMVRNIDTVSLAGRTRVVIESEGALPEVGQIVNVNFNDTP